LGLVPRKVPQPEDLHHRGIRHEALRLHTVTRNGSKDRVVVLVVPAFIGAPFGEVDSMLVREIRNWRVFTIEEGGREVVHGLEEVARGLVNCAGVSSIEGKVLTWKNWLHRCRCHFVLCLRSNADPCAADDRLDEMIQTRKEINARDESFTLANAIFWGVRY
jgi:hypothetical protein